MKCIRCISHSNNTSLKQDYDYFKYRGKVRANEKSFEQRRDRYFFKKLATKYSDAELLSYFVANFVNDSKGYLQSFSKDIYTDWKINQESFTYKFKQDVNTLLDDYQIPYDQAFEKLFVVECGHPPIIKHYLGGSISLETLVVFEKCLGFVSNFDKKLSDPIWKEVRTKTLKIQTIFNNRLPNLQACVTRNYTDEVMSFFNQNK